MKSADLRLGQLEDRLRKLEAFVGRTRLASHVAAADPHPVYLTQAEADLLYEGIGGGGGATATAVEVSLGSTWKWRGEFTITDAAILAASRVLVWQHAGPYTGKGALADAAEMEPVQVVSVVASAGSALVTWQTPPVFTMKRQFRQAEPVPVRIGKVRGNVKFWYSIFS